jgi:hypothetical protein
MEFTCNGCAARWRGVNACHCSACHRTFAGPHLFDMHRTNVGSHGTCRDPATLNARGGQPPTLRDDGIWHAPDMTEADRARRWGGE